MTKIPQMFNFVNPQQHSLLNLKNNGCIIEKNKTIVCGHWHCSFGHSHYEGDGGEFNNNPNFAPYYGKGVIALDACTPISKKVNCIVIED